MGTKFDEKAIMKAVKSAAKESVSKQKISIECPHCHAKIQQASGKHPCPKCHKIIDLKLDFKF